MLRFTLLLVLLAVVFSPSVNAQKVKKLKAHEVQLEQLPLDPLGGHFRTYSLQFKSIDEIRELTGRDEKNLNKKHFNLNRYIFSNGSGDFAARISLGNNLQPKRTTAKKTVQTGTRDAPAQDTQSYYNLTLQLPLKIQLLDGKRDLIREIDASGFKLASTFEFGPFGSDAQLAAKWRAEGKTFVRVKQVEYFTQAFNYAAARLRSEVDSSKVTRRVNFVTIKKAEKYGIANLETDAERATDALEAFAKNGDRAALTAVLKPLVEKWRAEPDKYDPKNKKEDDIRYAYAHNLALAAFLTGDVEAADTGMKAGFDWGKNSSWYQDLRKVVNVENARKRKNNQEWKPTKFTDVFRPAKPEVRRLKVYDSFTGEKEAYLVSRDTVYTHFSFLQVKKGKAMPKISIMSDTDFHKYDPLQMRTIFDGKSFYETIPAPKPGNNAFHWRLVKVIEKLNNGTVKLGKLERGKTKDGEEDTLPAEYMVYGSNVRRSVNLTGPDFKTDFNAGVLEFFGAEYPAVAAKAIAKKYAGTMEGYKALAADLATGK